MSTPGTPPQSSLILYQTEDGQTRVQCRFEDRNVWLTQALLAELFQKDVRTINEHLVNIFAEGELQREATIRKFRIVRRKASAMSRLIPWNSTGLPRCASRSRRLLQNN